MLRVGGSCCFGVSSELSESAQHSGAMEKRRGQVRKKDGRGQHKTEGDISEEEGTRESQTDGNTDRGIQKRAKKRTGQVRRGQQMMGQGGAKEGKRMDGHKTKVDRRGGRRQKDRTEGTEDNKTEDVGQEQGHKQIKDNRINRIKEQICRGQKKTNLKRT